MNNDSKIQEIKIEPFSSREKESCAKLYADIFKRPPWNESWSLKSAAALMNKIINKKQFTGYAAKLNNKSIGYLMGYLLNTLSPFIKVFYLNELFVDVEYQNMKIGKKLVNTLLDDLRDKNIYRIVLLTKKDTNAEKFYGKIGFKRILPGLSFNKKIIMGYNLKNKSWLKFSKLKFAIFDSIEFVSERVWNSINSENNIFLSTDYLKALEKAPPKNMAFKYAILSEENRPVAVSYFQILTLDAGLHESLLLEKKDNSKKFSSKVHNKLKDNITTKMLACGNALLCGQHGFASVSGFNQTRLSKGIFEVMKGITRMERNRGKVNVLMVKDFYTSKKYNKSTFINAGYYDYSAGPNMVVPIRENWGSFEDYMEDLKAKYKKRVISAVKKGRDIVRRSLSYEEIAANKNELYELYLQVADKAKFKLFILNPNMLGELKRYLKDKFIVDAYYLDEKIIAYTTRIFNDNIMEGYSHGLDYELNKEYDIYQNILIDDIKEGIKYKVKKINFGRTSIAMKSSLGAIPENAEFFMQFKVLVPNQLVKMISSFFKPSEEHCRNPFA